MIPLEFPMVLGMVVIAIALAGISTERHFIVIMLAVELIFLASTILLVSFFSYSTDPNPIGVMALISVWSVAAAEVITMIAFYVYIKAKGYDFDVTKLSKMKW